MQIISISLDSGHEGNPATNFNQEWFQLDVPELELPEHAYGGTGYIDGLLPEDMTHPIMKGTDKAGRPFIAVRIHHQGPVRHRGRKECTNVEVYFQRYSSENHIWVSGGPLSLMTSNMKKTDKAVLQALIKDGEVTVEDEHYLGGGNVRKTYRLV
jgi:hypothetical protein